MECLPSKTRKALRFFSTSSIVNRDWYLAGGTALTLQAGHRRSVDLDFFTSKDSFNESAFERKLLRTKKWQTTLRETGTLYGEYDGAKMSFIAYPFFHPSLDRFNVGSVQVLTQEDIAVMKVIAVSQRGRKRDFIDLHWYCTHVESLTSLLKRAPKQYPGQEENVPHFLKSLVYFEDAESDPMPQMTYSVSWNSVKKFFRSEVRAAARELLF
jgi:predicted nucleotidyltransferase component of viral defense system